MKLKIISRNKKYSFLQKGGRVDYDNKRKIGKRWFAITVATEKKVRVG